MRVAQRLAASHAHAGPEHVSEVRGHHEDDGAHDDHGVHPQIPRDQEARHLAEPLLGPLVEPAFQRHQAIEVDHDRRQRHVKREHRRQPEDHVRAPQFRRNAHPARTDHAEHLRQHEVAQAQFLAECGFFLHGSTMMPQGERKLGSARARPRNLWHSKA